MSQNIWIVEKEVLRMKPEMDKPSTEKNNTREIYEELGFPNSSYQDALEVYNEQLQKQPTIIRGDNNLWKEGQELVEGKDFKIEKKDEYYPEPWHENPDESICEVLVAIPIKQPHSSNILLKDIVLEEYQKGNIVIATGEGLAKMPLKEFMKQPVEGMLYDLNRNEAVVLTFIDDPKWINDFAVAKVIQELKKQLDNIPILENPDNDEIRKAFESTPTHGKPYGTTDGYINTLRSTLREYGLDIYKMPKSV